ncbi:alpha/beta fold hydrolase [Marinibactrum halimedae]|uniref:Hydrolase n=1 Tax=Marinibactrum halimedae TaxID=1444977 RepID=A0AA37T5G4_9GAMM|nr:alpha/beta hydrolase [Marinibactrum halimedae]MCD9458697.1 alpha/beta hydrolase [Marinibactrum halimedae]GLS25936.1 hydrolase [Marinibactrum halimedae]
MNPNINPDLAFSLGELTLKAKQWGSHYPNKILALHGWLDNAGSFNVLAPLIQAHIIAIDLAGHGQSDHRHSLRPYHLWDDVADVFSIADQLGWNSFGLLGHSRGAMISTLSAGTFPERIEHLWLIDAIWPEHKNPSEAPDFLATAIRSLRNIEHRSPSLFPTREQAITARAQASFPISKSAAEHLAERGLKVSPKGAYWCADQKLQLPSAIKLSRDHIHAFVKAVTAPITLILAEGGLMDLYPKTKEELAYYPEIHLKTMQGGHHLHMEDASKAIAELINSNLRAEELT